MNSVFKMTCRLDRMWLICMSMDLMWQLLARDDISITLNHPGSVIESSLYRLQCHIPEMVKATSVKWYKGQSLVHQETLYDIIKTPELTITPNRADDGVQYRCEVEFNGGKLVSDLLNITVYYISITLNHTGSVIESGHYRLQCHIPEMVKATSVKWYEGQSLVHQETLYDIIKTPELTITPNRADDGVQYRCEVEFNEGKLVSDLLNITVYFKPVINESILHEKIPVFRGYPLVLVCEAEGNPKPTVSWSNTVSPANGGNLTITEAISQNPVCTASNSVGSISREVTVVPTEDYLPLIAGLVAVTVAVISVIFVFIYSIYYKTAKMGHYSLKDAKPSPQNGNIAQNGKENPLPMKKLSQSDILAYP